MNTTEIIIGNVCSAGAMFFDSYSGTGKTKKRILLAQCASQVFYAAGSITLKGYSAVAQNIVTILRNTYAVYGKGNRLVEWFFVILPVASGIVFNNRGILGLLPVMANLQYSLTMIFSHNEPTKLRWSFMLLCIMFSIFNFAILNFVSGFSCIITIMITLGSLIKDKKKAKAKEADSPSES